MREGNSSKNLVIKLLSENQSALKGCLPQQSNSYEAYYDSNTSFIDPKKTEKCHKKKDTPHNFSSLNSFSSLDFHNDIMIMENNSHDKDPASYTKENTDKQQNSINIHQQCIVPGNHSYANATRHQRRKAVVTDDSHLNRINKSSFKNDNAEHAVYFKCFSGSNTKQLNYYANPTLVDEQPDTVIVHIGSNNINKFNHNKVDVEFLAQRIIDNGKKMQVVWRK